jgi:hypothetical protein
MNNEIAETRKIPQMEDIWTIGVCYCPEPDELEGNLCGRCGGKVIPVEKPSNKRIRASPKQENHQVNDNLGVKNT